MKKILQVWLYGQQVGCLGQDLGGRTIFDYDPSSNHALSLSLPLTQQHFDAKECLGFFNGLLPEGEDIRKSIARKYGVNAHNDFSLLSAIGYDCAGAVSFLSNESEEPTPQQLFKLDGEVLSEDAIETLLFNLPKKPLATSHEGMRLSLAGAQHKTALLMLDQKLAIPAPHVPSSHIIKPAIEHYDETIENEYICMESARAMGLDVPPLHIAYANSTKYFIIERYDRQIEEHHMRRIHQEDFCQACNIASAYKYQKDGGVSYKNCAQVIMQTKQPAVALNQLLQRIVFNCLIGNYDAHGKNFSLLHLPHGEIKLAPCYDILCTQVYPELSTSMAMKIAKEDRLKKLKRQHFNRLAEDLNVNDKTLAQIWIHQAANLPEILEKTIRQIDNTIGERILHQVQQNCRFILDIFGHCVR